MNNTKFEAEGSQLVVTRTFNASVKLVWRAWTEPELLDQWWAPSPWKSKTRSMDFKEGGNRLYAMCGPEGEEHWALTSYERIDNLVSFASEDAFCDNHGVVNKDFPVAQFKNNFEEKSDTTIVKVVTQYASKKHLQQVIDMGMKEGLSMAYENLDNLIDQIKGQE